MAEPDRVLAAADAFFVYAETRRVPQTVVAAAVGAETLTRDGLAAHVASCLDALPWMRRVLVPRGRGLLRPAWRTLPAVDVDVDAHVLAATLPPPGGSAGLAAFAAEVAGRPLPRDRPPWRMWVLPGIGPVEPGQVRPGSAGSGSGAAGPSAVGLVVAVHHAICDGPALIDLLGPLFVPPVAAAPARPSPRGPAARRAAAGRAARGVLLLATDGMVRAGPFTRTLSPARRLAVAGVPLPTVRAAGRSAAAQPTDVVLAALAGAIARVAPGHGGRPLRVAVPVLARGTGAPGSGNRTAALWVRLPLDEPDPVRRLRRIAADRARGSTSARAAGSRLVVERLGSVLPAPLHALAVRGAYRGRFFHAIVSVMPGPRRPVRFGPAELHAVHPVLPLAERVGLGLGALVWGDQLCLGLVGEVRAVPDPAALLAAVVAEIEQLAAAAPAH